MVLTATIRTTPLLFTVRATPRPQPRPRFVNGRVISTAKKTTVLWRLAVARAAKRALEDAGHGPGPAFSGSIGLSLAFLFRPGDKFAYRIGEPHTQRPDADNLAKGVMDVLQSVGVFADDAKVAELACRKVWSAQPGCHVRVWSIAPTPGPGEGPQPDDGCLGYADAPEWLSGPGGAP